MSALSRKLAAIGACSDAVAWAKTQTRQADAWRDCQRGDWMLWVAWKLQLCSRQELVLALAACARLALVHTKDPRVLACIEAAEGWARGTVTLEQLQQARHAAADAADAAAYAAAYAADAAAYAAAAAADAAYAAAYAADAAAYAADAADAAADAAAYAADAADADARAKTLAQCADIVRECAMRGGWKIPKGRG